MNTQTQEALNTWEPTEKELLEYAQNEELFLFADQDDFLSIANGVLELVQIKMNTIAQPAQEPVARIELFNLLTKNGGFATTKEWLWSIRYVNSKGIVNTFPNEYPSEKKYAVQSAKYWANFLNCKIVEVDTRG